MNNARNPINPYHSFNGGGPAVPPLRTLGNYTGSSAPRQAPPVAAEDDSAGGPASIHPENIGAALDTLGGGQQQQGHPHMQAKPAEGESEGAGKGIGKIGRDLGIAGPGEGGGAGALEEVGIIGGLL